MMTHILIVEDESDIRDALREFFESEGFEVSAAANGAEAFEILERGRLPNLILLDLMMPVMNGEQFVELRKQHAVAKKVPVVVMSADNHTRQKAVDLGVEGYLRKPVDLEDLLNVAKEFSL
jgi:CheY-like chemotaxis protein